MPRGRSLPCDPRLDAILENYFSGPSIKSVMSITARSTTSPVALTRVDVTSEVAKLMRGLTDEEWREVVLYYEWRELGDIATTKATAARQEARNRGKRRKVRDGIGEIERAWSEKRNAPR